MQSVSKSSYGSKKNRERVLKTFIIIKKDEIVPFQEKMIFFYNVRYSEKKDGPRRFVDIMRFFQIITVAFDRLG